MNIVQLNQYIEKIARCIQIVHSYSSQSPYEYWNAKGDVQYGSVCFCIKKSRMRSNTITYDAVLYYGDRVVDSPSNKEQIWSDANNVIQNMVGTINMQSGGEVSVSYPYDITNFEQKFADNLAGAYATLSIETRGIGECGDLLYGYEEEDKIKLESIVKTITVNGEYDITSSKDYDAISDVKVIVDIPLQEKSIEIDSNGHHNVSPDEGYEGLSNVEVVVNVTPDPKDTFASIGYNDETAGGFLNQFSADLELSKRILDEWNRTGGSSVDMRQWKNDAVYFPAVDLTMKPTGMDFRFDEYSKLQVVPSLDFTGKTSTSSLFYNCSSLISVGNLTGTERVTSMSSMFYNCKSLTSIPQLNTSSVSFMSSMFEGCSSLTAIPPMDTKNVTNTGGMFKNCTSLTAIPPMDTKNVTDMHGWMGGMFEGCSSLTAIPPMDTKNVTDMRSLFEGCSSLTTIPQLNTSSVKRTGYMFNDCSSLTSIPLLDFSSVTEIGYMFGFGFLNKLTDLGGFKDLKANASSYFLDRVPNATVESLMNVINNLYDLTANGLSGKTINFGTTNLNKLTDEQKAVAINKGWTLT